MLVVGATGQQGGATVDALLESGGVEVFGMTRNPEGGGGQALRAKGATPVRGDWSSAESIAAAMAEIKPERVFLMSPFSGEKERTIGCVCLPPSALYRPSCFATPRPLCPTAPHGARTVSPRSPTGPRSGTGIWRPLTWHGRSRPWSTRAR